MVRTLQAPAAPESLFAGAQVLNVVNPDKRSRAALLFSGCSDDSNCAVLIAFDRFYGRVDLCTEEYRESVTEIQERLPVVGFTHVCDDSVVNTEFPWFGSLGGAVMHTLGDGSFDKALVKQHVNLCVLVLVKDSLDGQGQEIFQAPYLSFSPFTIPSCLASALLALRVHSRNIIATIFAGSTAIRIGLASKVNCDIDVLSVFISFDDPFLVLVFWLFIGGAFRGFIAIVDVSLSAPVRSVTPPANIGILGIDGNNPARAKISAKIAPTADHVGVCQASFFEFLDREVFFSVFAASSSHMFFPSISVDRLVVISIMRELVGGRASHWRAGRLALSTPREPADPIFLSRVGYAAVSWVSPSLCAVSRTDRGSATFLLLVMNTGPLIMMFSVLMTTPGLDTPGTLNVGGAGVVGVGLEPYLNKVRAATQPDIRLPIASISMQTVSIVSPFGISEGNTGGFAHAGRERVSVFPSRLVGVRCTLTPCAIRSRVLVKKGRRHRHWWCGSPRFPLRRAGKGWAATNTLVCGSRPRPYYGGPRFVRRREVAV